MRSCAQTCGFTLIELSVVVVIIGMLVGGILTGLDLIRAAEVRADIATFEKYSAATNTFRNKYGGLPGDMSNATNFFSATPTINIANGNGDGILQSSFGRPVASEGTEIAMIGFGNIYIDTVSEMSQYFAQLSLAGFIQFTPDHSGGDGSSKNTIPTSKIGGQFAVYKQQYSETGGAWTATGDGNYYFLTALDIDITDFNSMNPWNRPWNAETSFRMDSKIDDGKPLTGTVRTSCAASFNNALYDAIPGVVCRQGPAPCVTASGEYNVSANPKDCGLRVRAGF